MSDAPHSSLYFTPTRDLWHSAAQLERCVRAWQLHEARDVLDLGCGQGHWSRALAPHLPALRSLVGVDAEQAWVDAVIPAWKAAGISAELRALRGDVHTLPFDNESFDLVTCQTVLIHVRDVPRVLSEARRVLRPNGKILLCEPNNLANIMAELAADPTRPCDDVLTILRYHLLIQRGKLALGLGDNSLGERVIGLLASAGFSLLGAVQVERVHPLTPPYASEEEQLAITEQRDLVQRGIAGWPRTEARSYYSAAQGSSEGFDALYDRALSYERELITRIDRGQHARAGGGVQYLVCAAR